MKIDHFGYLTNDIERSIQEFIGLGFKIIKTTDDSIQNIDIVFLKNGDYVVELIKPLENSIIKESFLEKFKNTFYHIAFKVKNIDETAHALKTSMRAIPINKKIPATAFKNKDIQFFITNIGIIELIEE